MKNILLKAPIPGASETAHWVNETNKGYTGYDIFVGFVNSTEFEKICNDYGIIRGVSP